MTLDTEEINPSLLSNDQPADQERLRTKVALPTARAMEEAPIEPTGGLATVIARALDEARNGNEDALHTPEALEAGRCLSDDDPGTFKSLIDTLQAHGRKKLINRWQVAIRKHARAQRAAHKSKLNALLLGAAKDQASIDWPDWTDNQKPDPRSTKNVRVFLSDRQIELRFNQFTDLIEVSREMRNCEPVSDALVNALWLEMQEAGCRIDHPFFKRVVEAVGREVQYHPVRDWLESRTWDRQPRIDKFFEKYVGVERTELNSALSRKFFLNAVRRVAEPGCPLYTVIVLEGKRGGEGKSSLIRTLVPNEAWFTDCLEIGMTPKEVIEQTRGKWLVEASELGGLKKRDYEATKSMITRRDDEARLVYGHFTTSKPRQFHIIGTTNKQAWIPEEGGERRFSPMPVGAIDLEGIEAVRDQLWAEAYHHVKQGESHNIDPSLWEEANKVRQSRIIRNPLEHMVEGVIASAPPGFLPTQELRRACELYGVDLDRIARTGMFSQMMAAHGFTNDQRSFKARRERGFVKADEDGQSSDWLQYDGATNTFQIDDGKFVATRGGNVARLAGRAAKKRRLIP